MRGTIPVAETVQQQPAWWRAMGDRATRFVWIKAIGTPLGIALFFVGYFLTLRHPLFPITTMPLLAADRWLPFTPELLPLYASLWLYVSLQPALLADTREIKAYVLGTLGLSLAGFAVFVAWPTQVPAFDIDWAAHPGFERLKELDVAGNACPSLHAAFAVYTAWWLRSALADIGAPRLLHVLNWLWCAGIVVATVAVRQHVVLDAATGVALGALVAGLSVRRARGRPTPLTEPAAR